MFKISRSGSYPPTLDLSTMRETLNYMHGEMARVPSLRPAAAALETAIREIEAAERQSRLQQASRVMPLDDASHPRSLLGARFVRFKH